MDSYTDVMPHACTPVCRDEKSGYPGFPGYTGNGTDGGLPLALFPFSASDHSTLLAGRQMTPAQHSAAMPLCACGSR
jgi:hypothetical protein